MALMASMIGGLPKLSRYTSFKSDKQRKECKREKIDTKSRSTSEKR